MTDPPARADELDAFIAQVAHDLRAPLANIQMAAGMLEVSGQSQEECLDIVRRGSERAIALIDEQVASVRSDAEPIAPAPCDVTALLVDTYDYVWNMLRRRIDGLSDDEYLWEPVASCLTVRQSADGRFRMDRGEWPETGPSTFTTIAWRMCHIADNFTEDRIPRFFGIPSDTPIDEGHSHPATAAEGIAYMERAYESWRAKLSSANDARLWTTLDEEPYVGKPLLRFVLHYVEELAHHAAEVALLRDLYQAQRI